MKLQIVFILLMYCITLTVCQDCSWSGCEGLLINDQQICDYYGMGIFSRQRNNDGCDWDTSRRYCCRTNRPCLWTGTCYGTAYGPGYACNREFGSHYRATGNQRDCGGAAFVFECCQ